MQITPASILSLAALISATGSAVAALPTYSTYGNQDLATRDFEDDLDLMAREAPEHKEHEHKEHEHEHKKHHHHHGKHHHGKHAKKEVKMLKSVAKIINPLLKKEAAHGTERFICQIKTSAGKNEAQFVETKDGKVTHVSHIGKSHDIHSAKHARRHHHHHRKSAAHKHHESATCVSFTRGTVHKAKHVAHKEHHHSKLHSKHSKHEHEHKHKHAHAHAEKDAEEDDEEEHKHKHASKHGKKEEKKTKEHHKHEEEDEDDDEADKRSFFEEQFYYGY